MGLRDVALELRGVSASYGRLMAVQDVSLRVAPGEVVALFGHNGAGKTTLLRTVVGLKSTNAGSIRLFGQDMKGVPCWMRARNGIALVPEGVAGLFPSLTVRQNLASIVPAQSDALTAADEMGAVLRSAFKEVLVDRADQIAGSMSGGQRQMLAVSLALLRLPSVLLLDEPSTGLAPSVVVRLFEVVAEIAHRTRMAVVVVEQDVAAAMRIATRVAVVQSGTIAVEYSKDDFPSATELWKYL